MELQELLRKWKESQLWYIDCPHSMPNMCNCNAIVNTDIGHFLNYLSKDL